MSSASSLLHGVTEARGSYNRHAATQAAGGALALPLLEKAVQALTLGGGDGPIVIADYGSSQGRNSLAPMRTAVAAFRRRAPQPRPICVVHVDVAENDFSTPFDVLDTTPDSEVRDADGSVIPGLYAAGRTTAGIAVRGYVSGISLGDGSFFGRRAGQAAASRA